MTRSDGLTAAHGGGRLAAFAQAALRGLWFAVVPAALAALALRYLVPPPDTSEGLLHGIASIGRRYPVPLGFALFLLFTSIARYWQRALPGGKYLSALSPRLAARARRADLPALALGAELHRAVARCPERVMADKLTAQQREALDFSLRELGDAIVAVDAERAAAATRTVGTLAAPALAARARRQSLLFFGGVALAALAALFLRVALVESYEVLSSSMLPSLAPGDRILANKAAYGLRLMAPSGALKFPPRRGDVVVFQNATGEGPAHLVKRVIGLPGDRIAMRGDHPVVNGQELASCDAGTYVFPFAEGALRGRLRVEFLDDQAYLTVQSGTSPPFRDSYEVKPGEIFVLGDNRSNSSDSRAWNGGHGAGVPFAALSGRAQRFLVATHRDGRADFGQIFGSLVRRLHLEAIDTSELEQGVARCLQEGPHASKPPAPPALPDTGPSAR